MEIRRALACLPAALVIFCACGGRSQHDEAEASSVPPDIAAACANEESTACTTEESCEGGFATLAYGSVDNCISRRTRECELEVASLGTDYGAPDITSCALSQAAQTCNEWIGTLTPGCGFNGTKASGEPCLYSAQCASHFCDDFDYYAERNVCGVCAPLPNEGDACTSSCGAEGVLSCEHDASGVGRCVRLGSLGDACDHVAVCAPGFGCAIPAGSATGQCLPSAGNAGDPCDVQLGPLCDYRRLIYCNALTDTCAKAKTVAPGAACGVVADGSIAICAGGVCTNPQAGSVMGTCAAYLPDGSACTFGPGIVPCEPPALCASGVCRIVGGELCE